MYEIFYKIFQFFGYLSFVGAVHRLLKAKKKKKKKLYIAFEKPRQFLNPVIVLYCLFPFQKQCHKTFYKEIIKVTNIQKLFKVHTAIKSCSLQQIFLSRGNVKVEKSLGGWNIKLYWDEQKSKFISWEDYLVLLLELLGFLQLST